MPHLPRKLHRNLAITGDLAITGGLEVTTNTTLAGAATITGTLTQTGVATFAAAPVFSAGVASLGAVSAQKAAITMSTGGYVAPKVQLLTGANCYTTVRAGTDIVPYGVTQIRLTKAESSNAANYKFHLLASPAAGVEKWIHVMKTTAASTQKCYVLTSATAKTFYASTFNAVHFTTEMTTDSQPLVAHLIGTTGGVWMPTLPVTTERIYVGIKDANT